MYKRISQVMFPVLAVLLVAALLWVYQVSQERNAVLMKAENNYQRAFHDLSFHVDRLSAELGNALAVNSTSSSFHRKCLVNVWRLTSEAQNEISQLPLAMMPIQKTEEFLSKISNFSYQTAVRDLLEEPISSEEMEALATLYERSKQISGDLRNMQEQAISNRLRWSDVEMALASAEMETESTLVQGFQQVDDQVGGYEEVNWGPSMSAMFEKRDFTKIEGKKTSADEIRQKAAKMFQIKDPETLNVQESGRGTPYHTYSVSYRNDANGNTMQMDYTTNGGHLIWFMNNRELGSRQISSNQAVKAAQEFLAQQGYDEMEAVNYDETDQAAHIVMVGRQDDVLIFPEKLTMKVALDQGDIIGIQASEYLMGHGERQLDEPGLTANEAESYLNPSFEVSDKRLALIENELHKEVLCYQFLGEINDTTFRIYLNADSGVEEKVEQIQTGKPQEMPRTQQTS